MLVTRLFINSSNFGVALYLPNHFSKECRDCIQTPFFILYDVLLFLGDMSTSFEKACLVAVSYMLTC